MKCDNCKRDLKKIARNYEMDDLDEDATEGQMADYFAAQESGECGDWGYGEIEYYCDHCKTSVSIIMDSLNDLRSLIKGWHVKAKQQDDYFSKYVFQYLSFIAHLKNNLFLEETNDRKAIQKLKRDAGLRDTYLAMVSQNKDLKKVWNYVIKELNSNPLYNSSRDIDDPQIDIWWNSIGKEPDRSKKTKGIIHDTNDWENMVEFWSAIRNNLFHGGKNPNISRDQFLVKYAYLTMSPFMDVQMKFLA